MFQQIFIEILISNFTLKSVHWESRWYTQTDRRTD